MKKTNSEEAESIKAIIKEAQEVINELKETFKEITSELLQVNEEDEFADIKERA